MAERAGRHNTALESDTLAAQLAAKTEELAAKNEENRALRSRMRLMKLALSNLLTEFAATEGEDHDANADDDPMEDAADADSDELSSDEDGENLALWNGDCYRCPQCHWEVDEASGFCYGECDDVKTCSRVELDPGHGADDSDSTHVELGPASHPDRLLHPRGYSPTPGEKAIAVPLMYSNRTTELRELLARGASAEMCMRYHLMFSSTSGIIALADDLVHAEYGGPAMDSDAHWYIYIGRQISRDPADVDGETFIHDLLEDVLFWGVTGKHDASRLTPPLDPEGELCEEFGPWGRKTHFLWELGREPRSGAWITRPRVSKLEFFYRHCEILPGAAAIADGSPHAAFDARAYFERAAQAPDLPNILQDDRGFIHGDEYELTDSETVEEEGETQMNTNETTANSASLKRPAESSAGGDHKRARLRSVEQGAVFDDEDSDATDGLLFLGFQDFQDGDSDGGEYGTDEYNEDHMSSSADSDFADTDLEEV